MNNLIKKHIMDNGLEVYLCSDNTKHTTLVELIVNFGGFDKEFISNGKKYHVEDGMAHLIEHLVCEHSCQGHLMRLFMGEQMRCNAYTNPKRTLYYFHTVDKVYWALEKLLVGVNNSDFSAEVIEKVKLPIYEEIRRSYDNKGARIGSEANRCLFNKYGFNSTVGTLKTVESFDKEIIDVCYKTFYQPKNEMLVISGRFDEREIIKEIKKICKKLDNNINFEIIKQNEPATVKSKIGTVIMPTGSNEVSIFYKIDTTGWSKEKKYNASYFIDYFLDMNFGVLSLLREDLRENDVICGSIGRTYYNIRNFIIVEISAIVKKETEFIDAITATVKNRGIFDKEIYETLRKDSKLNIISMHENPARLTDNFYFNKSFSGIEKIDSVKDIDSLSFREYKNFINKLSLENYSIIKLKDEK